MTGLLNTRGVTVLGIIALSVALAIVGCEGDGLEKTAVLTGEQPEAASELSIFEQLLGTIPDTLKTRKSVMINDYAAVRTIYGIPLPRPEAGDSDISGYIIGILGPENMSMLERGPFITGISGEAMGESLMEYLAFDARNVDQSAEAGQVPFLLEVALGRFDPDTTARALEACSECPPANTQTYNGVSFYSWGEDGKGELKGRNGPPAFDHLGRGKRIAVSSEYVYRTVETPGMKALIDSSADDQQSLADVAEFRLLAQAMTGLGAYGAYFSEVTHKISSIPDETADIGTMPGIRDNLITEIGDSSLLLPYLAFSTGVGRDDTGRSMALALVHRDEESAKANKERLEQRITVNSDLQAMIENLEGFTLSVDGRVLSAKLRGDEQAAGWKTIAFVITPLIPHE